MPAPIYTYASQAALSALAAQVGSAQTDAAAALGRTNVEGVDFGVLATDQSYDAVYAWLLIFGTDPETAADQASGFTQFSNSVLPFAHPAIVTEALANIAALLTLFATQLGTAHESRLADLESRATAAETYLADLTSRIETLEQA